MGWKHGDLRGFLVEDGSARNASIRSATPVLTTRPDAQSAGSRLLGLHGGSNMEFGGWGRCVFRATCAKPFGVFERAIVYNCRRIYTPEIAMSRAAMTRTNLVLETGKVRRLRKALQSRSNSEAVRRAIDERLAVEAGLEALRSLRKLGGLDDAFRRVPAKKR